MIKLEAIEICVQKIIISRTVNADPCLLRARHIPCPGKLGATFLASCQTILVFETEMRDHDFGKESKHGKHSIFPDILLD